MFKLLFKIQNNPINLNKSIIYSFGKWSKPKKSPLKNKEKNYQRAVMDDKAIKLSKAEEEELIKRKKILQLQSQETIRNTPIKSQTIQWENKISKEKLVELQFKQQRQIEGITTQVYKPNQENLDYDKQLKQQKFQQIQQIDQLYPNPNTQVQNDEMNIRKKVVTKYENSERYVNQQFWDQIQKHETLEFGSKRTGVLAKKIGMTTVWDKWGRSQPLTLLQVDRCQVVQVKTEQNDGINALQIGVGQKNLKRLKKPEIGHFMKANVPPKQELFQFKVNKENLLPVGFQLSVRHFTPGQYVDVQGISRGLGFQGVIHRWGFAKQCASHGTSLSHRSIGSTGQHQDPGRVIKGKKMSGHMGNKPHMVKSLLVYKIDATRSLIYVKGAVPGRSGAIIKIRDAYQKVAENEKYMNFPTFIPENDIEYAEELILTPPEDDPEEIYLHDNDVVD